jgi:hypothetical protein
VLDEFASGSGVRAVSNGRIAAKCGPEGTPVTVSCRITETRPVRETVRKHSEDTATAQLALLQELEDWRGCGV